ncbi:hypothetical protein ACQ4PT_046996 [Festuca glaucescens]
MGKKKTAATSGATASAARSRAPTASRKAGAAAAAKNLDWTASSITKRDEKKLRTLGLISANESDVIFPGSDSRPKPPAGYTVMFSAFLYRGLSLPAHEFLRCLLFSYGIQLWQLTPNSILHLAIFITVCEAFLGIDPHWGLWRKIFFVKRHSGGEGPHVVGGVGFVVRKEVNYFNFPMRESVQGWQSKWFYLRDHPASGHRSNLPPFEDVLEAVPKKSWQNTLTAKEKVLADELYEKILDLKSVGGQTMCGTGVAALFLKRRVQPVMSRSHQIWLYTGAKDKTRINSADLTENELRDEVRRLTHFSQEDFITLSSVQTPYNVRHLPAVASTVARCFPPEPESGAAPEDDDLSEEAEEIAKVVEDNDAFEEEDDDDDALLIARRRRTIVDDLIDIAESSPSGHDDDDADHTLPDATAPEASATPATKRSSGFFADEDDLMSDSSDGDTDLPPSKKARISSDKTVSTKETVPLSSGEEPVIPPPPRKAVRKVKAPPVVPSAGALVPSSSSGHPIQAAVDIVVDFADKFISMEAENARLREVAKSSTEQLEKENKLATEAQREASNLKKELDLLKAKMKEEEQLKIEAQALADKKEGDLRKAVESAANMPVDRTSRLQVDSMSDAISFAVDSSDQIQRLLKKTKGALSKLFSLMFPKLDQEKTLEEQVNVFFVDTNSTIEVLKRRSRLYGAILAFQLLMGYGFDADMERLTKALPKNEDGSTVNLGLFNDSACKCAGQLLKLVEDQKKKSTSDAAPSSSAQTQAP